MQRYNKFILAMAGAVVTGLVTFGVVDEAQASALNAALGSLLTAVATAIGVWAVPNKG